MPTTHKTPTAGQKPARRRIAGERRPRDPEVRTAPTPPEPAGKPKQAQEPKRPKRSKRPRPSGQDAADPPSRWMLLVVGLLVVAVAATATVVVRNQLESAEASQRAEALDSALTAAPARAEKASEALLSYSHDSIDADIARTTPFLTKEYGEEYTTTMRDVVADPAEQTSATVRAKVLSSGVVDAGPERTDVLVFVNQVTESTNSDKPSTALNRAILTMVKRDGQWVVSDLKGL